MELEVGEDSRMKRHTAQWREAEPEMWWQPRQVWTCGSMATADKGACGLCSGLVLRLPGGSDHHPLGPCKNLGRACGMEPRCCCFCACCSPFCREGSVVPWCCWQAANKVVVPNRLPIHAITLPPRNQNISKTKNGSFSWIMPPEGMLRSMVHAVRNQVDVRDLCRHQKLCGSPCCQ